MAKFNLDMNDSYNQVKMHRQIIGPNIIFMSQIMLGPMICPKCFEAAHVLRGHPQTAEYPAYNKLNNFQAATTTHITVLHTNSKD